MLYYYYSKKYKKTRELSGKKEKIMKMINLTPHALNIQKEDGTMLSIPASGIVARAEQESVKVEEIDGVAVYSTSYGAAVDLPEMEEDTIYITSVLTAQAVKGQRDDVYFPGTMIRDDAGNIIGCIGLSK